MAAPIARVCLWQVKMTCSKLWLSAASWGSCSGTMYTGAAHLLSKWDGAGGWGVADHDLVSYAPRVLLLHLSLPVLSRRPVLATAAPKPGICEGEGFFPGDKLETFRER